MNEGVNFEEGDLSVDLSAVEEATFELMPRGNYGCIIQECEFNYSASKGTPMWSLQLEVEDGDFAGRKLYTHWVWAGPGLPFTKTAVARVAPELLESAFDPKDTDLIDGMIGRRVVAKVTTKSFEGEKRNNVAGLFAAEDGGFA